MNSPKQKEKPKTQNNFCQPEEKKKKRLLAALITTCFIILLLLLLGKGFKVTTGDPTLLRASINEAFTYQGKITDSDGTNLLSGDASCISDGGVDSCDFRISLYTAESGGTLVWRDTKSNVEIGDNDGIFNLNLDCGGNFATCNQNGGPDFANGDLYAEVEFDPSGNGDFSEGETFTPRRQMTAVPYAFHSKTADDSSTLDTLDSTAFLRSSANDEYETGNILTFTGDIDSNGNLSVADTDIALDGVSTNFSLTGDFSVNTDDLVILKSSGNVGIGTTNPGARLEVEATDSDNAVALLIDQNDTGSYDALQITNAGSGYGINVDAGGMLINAGDSIFDEDVIIGGSTSRTETLSNSGFDLNGDDLFVAGEAGIEGDVHTDGSFIAGSTLILDDDYIRDSGNINLQADDDFGDYLYLDTTSDLPTMYWEGVLTYTNDPGIGIDASGNLVYRDDNESGWTTFDSLAGGGGLWTDGTNGYYSNTEGIIVGPDTTETLSNADFSLNAGDLFVSDQLGVEGNIYTDGSFIAGNTLTLTDGSISQSTGLPLNINLGGSVGDDLIIDTDTLVVESDNNRVGINTTDPEERFTINGGNYLHKAGDPVHVGSITDDGTTVLDGAMGVYVSGKYAYITALYDDGLEILDISDPTNPTHVGAITDDGTTSLGGPYGVYVSGKYAYIASYNENALEILDISDPTNPTHVGAITDDGTTALMGAYGVYVSGKYAYVASNTDDGVEILDISDPTNPAHVGVIFDDGTRGLDGARNIHVQGDYAYVTGFYDSALEILDISDPTNPTHVGVITDNGTTELSEAIDVYVSGRYAYVTGFADDGLEILDISDPTNPTHVGAITDNGTTVLDGAYGVYVSGKYAYVGSYYEDGLEILDISDPTNPTHVGAITDDGTTSLDIVYKVYVSGKYAYVTGFADDALQILDISGISAPAATIGDLNTSTLDVTENASIANDLYVNNGLMVGTGGILSSGPTSTNTDLPTNYATTVKNDGNNTNRYGMLISAGEDTGSGTLIQFNDGDGTDVGEITFSGTTTTYGTSSDRRMKENIISTSMGIEDLMKVQVRDYEFKSDNTNMTYTGFIAQELIEVFPHAVFAPDDGRMWSVDYGKITPLLAKAIQDQQGMITNIEKNYNALTTTLTDQTTTNQEKFTIIGESITELTNELDNYQTETNNSLTTLTTTIENLNDLTTLMTDTLTNHEERIQNLEAQISNLTGNPIDPDNPTNNLIAIPENLQTLSDNLTTETIITTEIDPETGEEITIESYLFDVEGNLTAKALATPRVDVEEIAVKNVVASDEMSGKGFICGASDNEDDCEGVVSGDSVVIETSKVKEDSQIYITPIGSNHGKVLYVEEETLIEGESFVVKFDGGMINETVKFNWLIIN